MKTVVSIIITIIATVLLGGIALQEGFIPGFGPSNTTTIIKSYDAENGDQIGDINAQDFESCETPRGESVAHSEAVISFNQESALLDEECESRTSICNNGNYVDGLEPYEYKTCEYILPEVCEVNEFIFAHNTSRVFYTEGNEQNGMIDCDSQERICNNGEVSGDSRFQYLSCFSQTQESNDSATDQEETVSQQEDSNDTNETSQTTTTTEYTANRQPNCPSPFGGSNWAPGTTGMAYPNATVRHNETCQQVSIVCAYGSIRFGTADNPKEIAPDGLSQTCQVQPAVPCQSACGTIPHGSQVTTYQEGVIPFGSGRVCADEQIISTCNDGTLFPAGGTACECQIGDPVGCVAPNGATVTHLGTITLFENSTVQTTPGDDSASCNSQWRQCINGGFYDRNSNKSPLTFEYESCEIVGGQ